jgi:hypothetical protein
MMGLMVSAAMPVSVSAQPPESARVEAGAQVSAFTFDRSDTVAGVGGRVVVALTPRIAIDTRVTLFPADLPPDFRSQGGRTLEVFAGARGKFITARRFSVYGVLLPGLLHVSRTITDASGTSPKFGGATHFAVDMGTGVEFYPTSRWVISAEWTGPLYAVSGAEISRSDPSPSGAVLTLSVPASIKSTAQFSGGLAYRMGALHTSSAARPAGGRWTFGPQFGYTAYTGPLSAEVTVSRTPAIGAFGSFRIIRWVYADGAFAAQTKQDRLHSPFGGGHVLQALGGVKIGTARDRVGFFMKARAGVQNHGAALKATRSSTDGPPLFGSARNYAVDVGAVIESYLSRRLMLRIDAGNVRSFYRRVTILDRGQPVLQPAPATTDSIHAAIGFGWRLGR